MGKNTYQCKNCGGETFLILPASCRIVCAKCRYMFNVSFRDTDGAELVIRPAC